MGTIKSVKSSMGYIAEVYREDACGGCRHFEKRPPERMPPWDKPGLWCRKGGFYTSRMAVCGQHEEKGEK